MFPKFADNDTTRIAKKHIKPYFKSYFKSYLTTTCSCLVVICSICMLTSCRLQKADPSDLLVTANLQSNTFTIPQANQFMFSCCTTANAQVKIIMTEQTTRKFYYDNNLINGDSSILTRTSQKNCTEDQSFTFDNIYVSSNTSQPFVKVTAQVSCLGGPAYSRTLNWPQLTTDTLDAGATYTFPFDSYSIFGREIKQIKPKQMNTIKHAVNL